MLVELIFALFALPALAYQQNPRVAYTGQCTFLVDSYCLLQCDQNTYGPVCGSDQRRYTSLCELLRAKCNNPFPLEPVDDMFCTQQKHPVYEELRVSAKGPVKYPAPTPTEASMYSRHEKTDYSYSSEYPKRNDELTPPASKKNKRCNPYCFNRDTLGPGDEDSVVCGSDGVLYGNRCLLEFTACSSDPGLTEKPISFCEQTEEAKVPDSECDDDYEHNPDDDPLDCDVQPCYASPYSVCGTNGITYPSMCALRNARCEYPGLQFLGCGKCQLDTMPTLICSSAECPPGAACKERTCPHSSECRTDTTTGLSYCADVCDPERCDPKQRCELRKTICTSAPCAPVATCIPI